MPARWPWIFVGSLTGCSILYWPSSDLTSGEGGDAAAGAETGAIGRDGPPPEAKADTGAPTCPPNALLCDDFERDRVVGPFGNSQGSVSISKARAHSPTRSLSAIAKKNTDSPALESSLALPTKATLSFWFYAATRPPVPADSLRIAHLLWGGACDWELSWTIYLNAADGLKMSATTYDSAAKPDCGPVTDSTRVLLTADQTFAPVWHHVVVTMDVSAKTRRVEAVIDDTAIPLTTVTSLRSSVPANATLAVGIPCITTSSGCMPWDGGDYEVLIDDVALVAAP